MLQIHFKIKIHGTCLLKQTNRVILMSMTKLIVPNKRGDISTEHDAHSKKSKRSFVVRYNEFISDRLIVNQLPKSIKENWSLYLVS